jgi:hypothetical protein
VGVALVETSVAVVGVALVEASVAVVGVVLVETSVVVKSESTMASVAMPTGRTSPPGITGTTISRKWEAAGNSAGKVKVTSTL